MGAELPDDLSSYTTAPPSEHSRRALLLGGAAIGVAAWVAPEMLSVSAAAATSACGTIAPALTLTNATQITPPPPSSTGLIEDSTVAPAIPITSVWLESGPTVLASALAVDATTVGTWTIPNTNGTASVPVGTTVFSYYVHARRTNAAGSAYFAGTIMLPAGYTIVGMAFRAPANTPNTLGGTNGLAKPGLTYGYSSSNGEGYEADTYSGSIPAHIPAGIVRDTVQIVSATQVRWYAFTGGNFSDGFRLLVAPVC